MLTSTLPLDRAHCSYVFEGFLFENRSKTGRRHVQFARRPNGLNLAGVQVHTLLVECMATKAGWPAALGGKSYEGEHFLDLLSDVPRMNSKTRSKKLLQKFLTRLHMKGTLQRGAFILHAPIDMGI